MANEALNYKCPACGAPLHYGTSGRVECDYCGSKFDISDIEEQNGQITESDADDDKAETQISNEGSWEYDGAGDNWGEEGSNMRTYSCDSCGAELIADETTSVSKCPYCDNPTVMKGNLAGAYTPDYVVPFKVTREEAIEMLKKHYKGKKLLPAEFKDKNHIEEIKGVYVPFWLFDGSVDIDAYFHATNRRSYSRGNERVTETFHYRLHRAGNVKFNKIPVDASTKMPDDLMDSIEPYNYDQIKPFSVSYLLGYMADKYDVSIEDCTERADRRAYNSAVDIMKGTCQGYEIVRETPAKIVNIKRGKVKYALMPVWMLSTKYNGKSYIFAVNGQTGKIVGNLPINRGKMFRCIFGAAAIFTVLFTFITYLIRFL